MSHRIAIVAALAGCALPKPQRCVDQHAAAGDQLACEMPGFTDRAYDLWVPPSWDGTTALPLIVALHGAASNRSNANQTTCPDGDPANPACMFEQANAAGYAVVAPDGDSQRPLRGLRAWNAGGGGAVACLAPTSCNDGADDVAYWDALLAEVRLAIPIAARETYAIGISTGAAMAQRLACERQGDLAAIVSVAGANEYALGGGACDAAVPILEIHGTDDPLWPYAGGLSKDAPDLGIYGGVDASMEGWRARNGCAATPVDEPLPDVDPSDGTTVVHRRWTGCSAATELMIVNGGGHTWPGGRQYLSESLIGHVTRDIGSDVILTFVESHVRP